MSRLPLVLFALLTVVILLGCWIAPRCRQMQDLSICRALSAAGINCKP